MTLYKVKFIEINNDDVDEVEAFLTQGQYRELIKKYKELKEIR